MPTYYSNGSLWIEIRPRETNHLMPHVHAHIGKYSVSITLDGQILAGNLRNNKRQAEAIEWVLKNKEFLEKEWRSIHNV